MFHTFDIIRVPFPFSDSPRLSKTRPALVVSSHTEFGNKIGHSVVAMITSAKHSKFPLDTPIRHFAKAGLPKECVVRMKLFTIDHRLVLEKKGKLDSSDEEQVSFSLRKLFSLSLAH